MQDIAKFFGDMFVGFLVNKLPYEDFRGQNTPSDPTATMPG